tara:strand:- start:34 stop:150 length:117 start_codon:yes stop_codon:yes gene_type:complete
MLLPSFGNADLILFDLSIELIFFFASTSDPEAFIVGRA